ncbi:hypothetical protein CSKR_106844 [Clonorchis sinensis]|uniref:Uncharacterized protein n=1 Tax=Clonorchis sinensis TaxID=79923 RepID=A0A3R7DC74_CLOSI|nr:hypothetical protein CSKR_106844 [Clonorchis sinensis]
MRLRLIARACVHKPLCQHEGSTCGNNSYVINLNRQYVDEATISMVRNIVRHGSVAASVEFVHPSYCLQCIAPFPTPPLNKPSAPTNADAQQHALLIRPAVCFKIEYSSYCGRFSVTQVSQQITRKGLTIQIRAVTITGVEMVQCLEREPTDRKVRSSNPTSVFRLLLSRLEKPGSIPAPVLHSGGMTTRHRKCLTAGRLLLL